MHHADFSDMERIPLYIFIAGIMLIPPDYDCINPKSKRNPDPKLRSGSGIERIVTGNHLTKKSGGWGGGVKVYLETRSSRVCYPNSQYNTRL